MLYVLSLLRGVASIAVGAATARIETAAPTMVAIPTHPNRGVAVACG